MFYICTYRCTYTYIQRERESHNPVELSPFQGLGESGIFLGCSVFFAIHDAVNAARQERGQFGPLKLNSPLTPEKIRMACEDKFTKMVCSAHKNQSLCLLSLQASFIKPLQWFSREEKVTRIPGAEEHSGLLELRFPISPALPGLQRGSVLSNLKEEDSFFIIHCMFLLCFVFFPGHIDQE